MSSSHDDDDDDDDIENYDSLPKRSSSRRSVLTQVLSEGSLLSKIYPVYIGIVGKLKRGVVAGWDAAWSREDERESLLENSSGDCGAIVHGRTVPKLHSFLGKTGDVILQVYRGAMSTNDKGTDTQVKSSSRRRRKQSKKHRHGRSKHTSNIKYQNLTTKPTAIANGGATESNNVDNPFVAHLESKYNIETNPKHHPSILPSTFSLTEALQKSNADARFLICYITNNNNINNENDIDKTLIPTLLHPQFTKYLDRKPLGKKNLQNSGSYYLYICHDKHSREEALKRFKSFNKKNKKNNSPFLAILYPATAMDSTGKLSVKPKLLGQYSCHNTIHNNNNNNDTANSSSLVESMSSWITSIRKRHIRDYAKLQHERRERMYLNERRDGYQRSVVEDTVREEKEKEEQRKRMEKEEVERKRMEGILARRVVLLENLPEEPENDSGDGSGSIVTIALRFQDATLSSGVGKTTGDSLTQQQRRFNKSDTMNDVFNWVDGVHGLEREKIRLSTMNGSKMFVYVDESEEEDGEGVRTLEEVGLGKMTALRVTEIEAGDTTVPESDDED